MTLKTTVTDDLTGEEVTSGDYTRVTVTYSTDDVVRRKYLGYHFISKHNAYEYLHEVLPCAFQKEKRMWHVREITFTTETIYTQAHVVE